MDLSEWPWYAWLIGGFAVLLLLALLKSQEGKRTGMEALYDIRYYLCKIALVIAPWVFCILLLSWLLRACESVPLIE